ncbi:MAG: ATP-binding protein [Cyanobacteria bacterium P01_F01_bin.53]
MMLDLRHFYKACNPSKTLNTAKPGDRKMYIDFSNVRGSNVIRELERTITVLSGNEPTCQLFTGHIGCGKSTELLRLKYQLEKQDYHVVYFESSQDLDMADVDITDILLAITRQVSESLEKVDIFLKPTYFKKLFQEIVEWLQTPIEVDVEAELSLGIGKVTAKTKESPQLRKQLRQYLEPRTSNILDSINKEFFQPAKENLRKNGQKGLVVIVDNLDRIDSTLKPSGRRQPEYLFVDRGEQLKGLNCHLVYTIPLVLAFSNDLGQITNRFGVEPKVLPMVPVKWRDESLYEEGLATLRRMVLARAFPKHSEAEQLELVTEIFKQSEDLDYICQMSGGHVRTLLSLLFRCMQQGDPPFSRQCLENVVRRRRGELTRAIEDEEWTVLRRVVNQKSTKGEEDYHLLLRSLFVYEYQDIEGSWFDINPILLGAMPND